jgi:hypothetical protein
LCVLTLWLLVVLGWCSQGFEYRSLWLGWLAAVEEFALQKWEKTRDQLSSDHQIVTAPFSHFSSQTRSTTACEKCGSPCHALTYSSPSSGGISTTSRMLSRLKTLANGKPPASRDATQRISANIQPAQCNMNCPL